MVGRGRISAIGFLLFCCIISTSAASNNENVTPRQQEKLNSVNGQHLTVVATHVRIIYTLIIDALIIDISIVILVSAEFDRCSQF